MVDYKTGFGIVPKNMMQDPDLSIEAKAIFTYIACYANNERMAFPSRDLICHHLGISKNRYTKYMGELKDKGYIEVTQVKEGNKFAHNVYRLISCPQNRDTQIEDTQNGTLTIPVLNNTNNNNNIYTDKKKTTKEVRHKYGEFKNVLLSDKDLEKLKAEYGEELVEKYIKKMDEWIELNGRRYKNYYLALRQWMNKEVSKKQEKVKKQEGDTKYDEEYFTKLMEETLRGGNKF